MYVVAAAYMALFALVPYLVIWGPADLLGLSFEFREGMLVFRAVDPDSLPGKAGVRAGDRLLSVDDRLIRRGRDWTALQNNLQVGTVQHWVVLRGEEQLQFEITPVRADWRNRVAGGYVSYTPIALINFVVGLFVAFRRPQDLVARVGAWFVATASIAFGLPNGWAPVWRDTPVAIQTLFWIPEISRFVLEGIFLSLFVIFPRRLFHSRWPWIVIWAPVLATLPWRVSQFHAVIFRWSEDSGISAWVNQVGFLRPVIYLAAGSIIMIVGYRRLHNENDKRRLRVLMAGTAVAVSSAITLISLQTFTRVRGNSLLVLLFVHPLLLTCPISFAYAILRHRVFDIQVIIRQGLQYAMARGAVIGVVPALGLVLVLDLALNSQETLAAIMRSRGWIYSGVSGLAVVTYWRRRPWLDAIDRRFFRERYNAQRVLRDVVEEIREARSFERVAPRALARIETALHPEFVTLMVRQHDEPQYRALASVPSAGAAFALAADSKLIGLMRVLEKPVDNLQSSSEWLERLSRDETDWVRHSRIDLLVPIEIGADRTEALLALGIKRSEELYTREDQELLETIASSLGLLLEQSVGDKAHGEVFAECPECGVCYDSKTGKCADDGSILVSARLPRTLAGRYRLEKRRGRGGMGTVYEAMDGALDRRVAIKVIRDDWIGNVEAAQRFRREARAAASFSHPNVVTVHDYGVEAGSRGFLVMELLEGRSLREELASCKRLDAGRTLALLRGVCAAVESAHGRQLIHRDLKPENVFLVGTGEAKELVKVLDFGIAKFLGPPANEAATGAVTETQQGVLVGTPAYMAPEQLLGSSPDVQWDLWALAVVAYEMLTGAVPFPVASQAEWRNAILAGHHTPLERYLENPPLSWCEFFAKTLAADATKRPHSATEFIRQLEDTLQPKKN